jgi:DNA-binding HxlR family transcriptional regulator
MADVTVKRLEEMETTFNGAMYRARASLEASSFGMQVIEMSPNADWYPSHNHTGEPADDGQEEIYTPLRGSATLIAGEERFELEPGSFARVGPAQKRKLVPGDEGARMLCLGAMPGKPYEPPEFTKLGAPAPQPPQ